MNLEQSSVDEDRWVRSNGSSEKCVPWYRRHAIQIRVRTRGVFTWKDLRKAVLEGSQFLEGRRSSSARDTNLALRFAPHVLLGSTYVNHNGVD